MPVPGGSPGMSGMGPSGGEVPEELAQMMGGSSSSAGSGTGAGGGTGGKPTPAQIQQMMNQGDSPAEGDSANSAKGQTTPPRATPPRPVGTFVEEAKRGFSDIFQGIKEFFSLNTWLGVNPDNLDPQQQQHAQQLHSRYQQLDQEQQAVAKQMYEQRMQKKRIAEEEEQRRRQIEADQKAQSVDMPSGPQKGPVGPASGKSKKQNVMTKLKQDRTTLNNVQGE